MTNFEHIKQMNIREIAVFIKEVALGLNVDWLRGNIQKWLESECEDNDQA